MTVQPASTFPPLRYPGSLLRQGWLGTRGRPATVATFRSWRGSQEALCPGPRPLIATYPDTAQKKKGLSQVFDPTGAGCGLQGTASSPSSTVMIIISRPKAF